jgi:NodT family efflux transporter outer membrane factor (OMF) lipoprotein
LSLGDAGLDAAIDRALNDNFSLRARFERLQAARALARRESAELWPDLNFTGSGERSDAGGSSSGASDSESTIELGLAASYELDLWGRLGALADAEALRADAEAALLEASALSISGEVALAWYRLAGAQAQKRVLMEQIETNRTVLDLLDARFQRGQIRAADVLRQRQLVEATVEQANDVDARIAVLQHLLATLQGRPPQDAATYSRAALIDLPALPNPGLPGALLLRRPDVRERFLRIQSADAELAAAISDRYPRVNLSAAILTNDSEDWSLFDDWLTSLAGQVALPLIDGGGRRAEVVRRRALLGEQIAAYGDTVLTAFREVEDALALEYHQRIKVDQLQSQLRLADTTYNQLRNQYLNGVSDYIDVLDALREQQVLERELVVARQVLIEFRIALHRATAGSLNVEPAMKAAANETESTEANPV